MKSHTKGFTLIELLVVVAIIGILSSVVLTSLNGARAKGRDAQRITNLKQIQNALELYALDHNGSYPLHDGGTSQYGYWFSDWGGHCGGGATAGNGWCDLENQLQPYISSLPRDPSGETQLNYYFTYRTHGNGTSYGIKTSLENQNSASKNDGGCLNAHYELGPSLTKCGCFPRRWEEQGTDLCP